MLLIRCIKNSDNYYYTVSKPKKLFSAYDIPIYGCLTLILLMILGIGPFKIIGIETPSMTPNINVGDAVIINKKVNTNKLKEKDVVAYKNKDNVIVVHRIININSDGTYITKGDYNNSADSDYVNKNQIVGKVILKIPYIAYPAIVFRGEK